MLAITSRSKLKIKAVKSAFRESKSTHLCNDIYTADCDSEVNEQPYGMSETLLGAENRLKNLKSELFNKGLDYNILISIENGVIPVGDIRIDLAFVIMEMRDGSRFISTSTGIVFDNRYVEEARSRGFFSNTVGSVIAEEIGCKSNDPHSALTENMFTRGYILREAVHACISQYIHSCCD